MTKTLEKKFYKVTYEVSFEGSEINLNGVTVLENISDKEIEKEIIRQAERKDYKVKEILSWRKELVNKEENSE